MDKEDIINYVMETPGNSNPAVLGSMLDSYGGGGSSGGGVCVVPITFEFNERTLALISAEAAATQTEITEAIKAEKFIIFRNASFSENSVQVQDWHLGSIYPIADDSGYDYRLYIITSTGAVTTLQLVSTGPNERPVYPNPYEQENIS